MYEPFFGGLLTVIRPLAMVEKQHIIKAAKLWELPIFSNPCPSADTTKRTDLLAKLDVLCKDSQNGKRNVYQGIIRWQMQKHLLAPEKQLDLTPFIQAKQEESRRRKMDLQELQNEE
jgi:tRNA(Ile)-lysidine synthase TilS/MesJ